MSTVLHPVGPEEPQTYWVRRAIVIGASVLALIVVIAIIVSQTSSGSVVAQPTPSPVLPSPLVTATETPAPSATPTPSDSASATATADPSTKASASPTATGEPSASSSAKSTTEPKAKSTTEPKSKAKAAPAACQGGDLRVTLTGKQRLEPKQANTFAVSLINGSGASCDVKVSSDSFELKVYSGTDRIWSTDDCAKSVKTVTKKLAKEQSLEWKVTWDGRRSRGECRQRPEIPRAGTYFATAQFKGAEPVQLRMILRG